MTEYRVVTEYSSGTVGRCYVRRETVRVCKTREEAEDYIESFMPGTAYWIHCNSSEPYVVNI